MLIFSIIKFLFVPLFCGFAVSIFFSRRTDIPIAFYFALALPLGLGLVSFWMLLMTFLGVQFSYVFIFWTLIIFSSVLLYARYHNFKKSNPVNNRRVFFKVHSGMKRSCFDAIEILISVCIGAYVMYVFWRAFNIPVYGYDAMKVTAFKAKMFYYDGALNFDGLARFRGYPPLTFLAHTWAALSFGQWDDQWVKIVSPVFYISFIFIQYYFVKALGNRRLALISLFLLICSPVFSFHATLAYMDFPLMVYVSTVFFLLVLWFSHPDDFSIGLPGVFAACACLTKREGTAFMMIFLLILITSLTLGKGFGSKKEKVLCILKFIAPGFIALGLFFSCRIKSDVHIFQPLCIEPLMVILNRLLPVSKRFFHELFLSGHWNILWFIFVLSFFEKNSGIRRKGLNILVAGVVSSLGMYFIVFSMTNIYYDWFNSSEALLPRMFLHFYPLLCVLIVMLNSRKLGFRV